MLCITLISASNRRLFAARFIVLLALAAVGSFAASAGADSAPTFRVVVNSSNSRSSISADFLTEVFLKKTTEWSDGETIRPADLKADSETRRQFSNSVLHRSVAAVKSYWQQMIFSGRGVPPPEMESDAAVIEYVARNRGAVGYVSGGAAIDRVKAVAVH